MRRLVPSDAADLAEIRKTSFDDFWSEREFALMLSDESFFGFREDHGFILCRRVLECIDIVTFCVEPQYRARGIGKNLLAELLNFAMEKRCQIFLEVAEKNYIARNMYNSSGFKQISIRKNYYKFPDGIQDAVVMSWKFCEYPLSK